VSTSRVLLLSTSPGGENYARMSVLCALPGIEVDSIALNEKIAVQIGDVTYVEQAGRKFSLDDYDLAIWWPASFQYMRRRLGAFYFPDAGQEYGSRAWRVIEEGLLATTGALLNTYTSSILAANKVYVMHAANKVGIPVPPSSIGNIASAPSSAKRVVIKTLTDTMDIDDTQKILTTEVDPGSLNGAIDGIPAIYQQRIDLDFEVRACYFDGVTTSIELRWPPGAESQSDIRLFKPEDVRMAVVDHPEAERYNALLAKRLNLRMFCADYLVDRAGKTWLTDVNPHGSWHWLALSAREVVDGQFGAMIKRILGRG